MRGNTRIIINPDFYLDPFDVDEGETCNACYGQGFDDDDAPCFTCGGEGYI